MNQRSHRPRAPAVAFAVVAALYAVGGVIGLTPSVALAAEETPADTLAALVRIQGHRCSKVTATDRDAERSRPDAAVWLITCAEGAYRVQLMPHQAAKIEPIESKK